MKVKTQQHFLQLVQQHLNKEWPSSDISFTAHVGSKSRQVHVLNTSTFSAGQRAALLKKIFDAQISRNNAQQNTALRSALSKLINAAEASNRSHAASLSDIALVDTLKDHLRGESKDWQHAITQHGVFSRPRTAIASSTRHPQKSNKGMMHIRLLDAASELGDTAETTFAAEYASSLCFSKTKISI